MKRILGYTTLGLIFCVLGFVYTYFIPRLESFALSRIKILGTAHSPFKVEVDSLKLKPWLLGAEMNNLKLVPKGLLSETLGPISISSATARLSLFGLIRGQVRIADIMIDTVKSQVFIKTDTQKERDIVIPLAQIFSSPVDTLEIKNLTLLGRIDPQNTVFKLENLHIRAENRFRSLWIDLNAPSVFLKPSGPAPPVEFQAEARGLIESDQIRLTALKVKRDKSFFVSSGFFWGDISRANITSSEMASRLHLDVASLKDWLAAFDPDRKLPKLSGNLDLSTNSGFKSKDPYINFQVNGDHLKFDRYEIGSVDVDGTYSKSRIQSLTGKIQNSSGILDLKKFNLSLEKDFAFEIQANSNIELGAFLKSIGLKNIPIHMSLVGSTKCAGVIKDSFKANCDQSEILAKNLHVYSKKSTGDTKTIVKFDEGRARGSFEVTKHNVQFAADLSIGQQSKGSTKGSVDFQSGFVIFFKGDHVDFSDLESLADLNIEGNGSLEGETRGNASTAKLVLSTKMREVRLDNFALGQISSQVRYEKGYLHLKDTSGLYGSTRYAGHLSINLPDSQLYIYLKSPYLELNDIKSIIKERLPLHFQTSGTGSAEFKGSGPLNIEKLNYEIKTAIFRGNIAGESFDSLNAELRAVDGVLSAEKFRLVKGPGEVNLSGSLRPAWTVDVVATGKNLRLEQSERISQFGLDLQGNYSFTTKVTGDIKKPVIEINGQTRNMITGSLPVDDSQVNIIIKETHLEGSAQLLGGRLASNFVLPFSDDHPFSLKVKASELNIASVFEAVSQARQTYDFQTILSLNADLSAPIGGFWKSTGLVSVDKFEIIRGGQKLASDGAMRLVFNQGIINSENFGLSGDGNYIKLDLKSSTKEDINGRLNGKVDLNILGPFIAFASEVRGLLSINTSFKGNISDINISGSAYLDKGYLKARDFPHPFTKLRADMLFNQKTLFLNSIQGEVADGKLSGDGRIRFEDSKSFPVNFSGQLKEASINFPEGYKTKGSAQFSLEGPRFPYRFKMDYDVTQAQIVSEFGSDGGKVNGIRQSPYLPPSIAKSSEEPFYLDLRVNFLDPILVSNSLVQASLRGNLEIQGTPRQLVMNGSLTPLPGGTFYFRDVPFEISTGFIEFDSVAPDNPKLYLAGSARVAETVFDEDRRQTEREYDVNVLVQGRAQNPQITLTSQPPLPQKDIVSLLALGLTPEALDDSRTTGQQVTSTSTTALGAALLQKPVGKRLKDKFGVDMKVTSSQTSADVASSARVTLSKQWTPKLSIAASGTLEANPQSSVRLEYQVSPGLSVIGSWEGREQGASPIQNNQSIDTTSSILGLDLEYRVQFK